MYLPQMPYIPSFVEFMNERTNMYKEIESLSKFVGPIYRNDWEDQIEYWIYEIPHIEKSIGWKVPIRGFKITEKEYKLDKGRDISMYDQYPQLCSRWGYNTADSSCQMGDREQWDQGFERQLALNT